MVLFLSELSYKKSFADLINVSDNRYIVIDNLKDYLHIFDKYDIDEHSFMDISVAAYLIHPNNEQIRL